MPHLNTDDYNPAFLFRNKHFNTIYPNLIRSKLGIDYRRERIETPDGDFLDLDFTGIGNTNLILLIHGLEGNAHSPYMKGMINTFQSKGWDTVSLNLRGCSGEINKKPVSYHSGKTDDIDTVVQHLINQSQYKQIVLLGFSLGGNLALKYAGEKGKDLPSKISTIAAISVPFDLKTVALNLNRLSNRIYQYRFLSTLKRKASLQKHRFPDLPVDPNEIKKTKDFYSFDNAFTAPVHGFKDAEDYWQKSSCRQFLPYIDRPTLMINALDDPFIPTSCIPFEEARKKDQLFLISPNFGGHVGFGDKGMREPLWHERKVLEFS